MYSPAGDIEEVCTYSEEQSFSMGERKGGSGLMVLEGVEIDVQAHWVDAGTVRVRQAMPAPTITTSAGQVVLTGLLDPVDVECEGVTETAVGGTITITFDAPGDYVIRLRRAPQYLDHQLTVTVP